MLFGKFYTYRMAKNIEKISNISGHTSAPFFSHLNVVYNDEHRPQANVHSKSVLYLPSTIIHWRHYQKFTWSRG